MFATGLLGPAGDLRQLLTGILGDEGATAKVGLGGVNAVSRGDIACLKRGLRVSDAARIPWIILGELGRVGVPVNSAPVNLLGRLGVVESTGWFVVVGNGKDAIKACFVDGEAIGVRTSENILSNQLL
jgi:hypothetical protein